MDMRTDTMLISADEHAQTGVSNIATATPLGPPGPRQRKSSSRVAQAGRATKARLAPVAVTHRYNRTHCLWLEQFQIAEYERAAQRRISKITARRSSRSARRPVHADTVTAFAYACHYGVEAAAERVLS